MSTRYVSYEQFALFLCAHSAACIVWTGCHSDEWLQAVVHDGSQVVRFMISQDTVMSTEGLSPLKRGSLMNDSVQFDIIWGCKHSDKLIRTGACRGINVGGDGSAGSKPPRFHWNACCMAYDIEVLMDHRDCLPTLGLEIASICVVCSCGYRRACYHDSLGQASDTVDACRMSDNKQVCQWFIDQVRLHAPVWLIGWNCCAFDNIHIEAALAGCDGYDGLFQSQFFRSPGGYDDQFQGVLNLSGVNNVDLMVQVGRQFEGTFDSLRLDAVSKQLGLRGKTRVDKELSKPRQEFISDLIDYNMNDCDITLDIWKTTNMERLILAECTFMTSPMLDVHRYVTGRMCQSSIAGYCMHKRLLYGWKDVSGIDRSTQTYTGGLVMFQKAGRYFNVAVVDFTSMYPNVIISCNISPDTLVGVDDMEFPTQHESVRQHNGMVTICTGTQLVTFHVQPEGVIPKVARNLLDMRRAFDHDPAIKRGIKSGVNAIYGTLRSKTSHVYSAECGASTTAGSRALIKDLKAFVEDRGYRVVYGDTDSCFISSGGSPIQHRVDQLVRDYNDHVATTVFRTANLGVDVVMKSLLIVGPKQYCYRDQNGQVHTKGLAVVRRDRIDVARSIMRMVIDLLLSDYSYEQVRHRCVLLLGAVKAKCYNMLLSLRQVSHETRHQGSHVVAYYSSSGHIAYVPAQDADLDVTVDYDPDMVWKRVQSSVDECLVACGVERSEVLLMLSPIRASILAQVDLDI